MRTPPKSVAGRFAWSEPARRAVDVARAPAVDAVEEAGHGHPGTGEFGASAPYRALHEQYGPRAERVAAAARASAARVGSRA
ncbi:hypothetical protein ACIGFK_08300 [Streptomyces sp. NPDC085524]|uniref:hypothetical protein n=1 Tax=unclassified Streptomyces TaxID=2593676 RepID=UPI0035DE817C